MPLFFSGEVIISVVHQQVKVGSSQFICEVILQTGQDFSIEVPLHLYCTDDGRVDLPIVYESYHLDAKVTHDVDCLPIGGNSLMSN
jgi:hypothetical protein